MRDEKKNGRKRQACLISKFEITADATVMERAACITNLQIYISYKMVQFIGDETRVGVTIRKTAGDKTLDLPAKGVFIVVGLEPNSSLAAQLLNLNTR
jgi:thioredoxin reductase